MPLVCCWRLGVQEKKSCGRGHEGHRSPLWKPLLCRYSCWIPQRVITRYPTASPRVCFKFAPSDLPLARCHCCGGAGQGSRKWLFDL